MMGTEEFLDVFFWSFTIACLYDVVYLFFFWRYKKALGIFLLILFVMMLAYFTRETSMQYPWDKLGELVVLILILGLIGCTLIGIATYIAYRALRQHDYKRSTITRFLIHTIAFSFGVFTFLLVPQVLQKLLG